MVSPNRLEACSKIQDHCDTKVKHPVKKDLLSQDKSRFARYSRTFQPIEIIDNKTLSLLFQLARESNMEGMRQKMFSDEHINFTEDRAFLHVALRNLSNTPIETFSRLGNNHHIFLSNFFTQTEALMLGKTEAQMVIEMGAHVEENIVPHKVFKGNKSTNSILFQKLTFVQHLCVG